MNDDDKLTDADRAWNIRCVLGRWGAESAAEKREEREAEERREAYINAHWHEGVTLAQRFAMVTIGDRLDDARAEREKVRRWAATDELHPAPFESEAARSERVRAARDEAFERIRARHSHMSRMGQREREAYMGNLNRARQAVMEDSGG